MVMNTVKKLRITAGALAFVLTSVFCGNVCTFAAGDASTVTMEELPESDYFNTKGSYHDKQGYEEWLKKGISSTRADKVLNGNYAFVVNCDFYWSKDHKEKAEKPAIYNDEEQIVISAEALKKTLGISLNKKYVTPEEAVRGTKWQCFTDPRGFVMFSNEISKYISVDTVDDNNPQYRSYYDVGISIGTITWQDVTPTAEDWQKARQTILEELTFIPGTEDKYKDYIDGIVTEGKELMQKLDTAEGAKLPFKDTSLVNCIGNTRNLARAYYVMKATNRNDIDRGKMKNAILNSLDMLFENYIGQNVSLDSNWFLNRITIPQMCVLIMLYMRDEMPKEDIDKYTNILFIRTGDPVVGHYIVPYEYLTYGSFPNDVNNPYTTFTNLFWCSLTVMELCLVAENTPRMNYCLRYLSQMFESPVNSGHSTLPFIKDGFYEDGSFLYHPNFAYNMGYGKSLLVCFADAVNVFSGTAFDLKQIYGYDKFYDWIEYGYLPYIYANNCMKLVMGRENPYGGGAEANSPIKAIMLLAINSGSGAVKEKIAKQLKPLVDDGYKALKTAKKSSTYPNFYYPPLNETVDEYLEYIHNMPAAETEPYNHAYYNTDRFVHKRSDYTFMLAMSSERVAKFEAINDGGYSDWYTSDGMTYVLKGDAQYIQRWWEYVDKYCLPGTTVGSNERRVGSVNFYTNVPANNSWAGGVSDGKIGVGGMKYPTVSNNPSNVQGTKSYFMLDDKIVCLGSGISGGSGDVYTTVENYISYEKPKEGMGAEHERGYVKAYVDGAEIPYEFDKVYEYKNPKWAWIDDRRGFVFLGENNVTAERASKSKRFCGNAGTTYNEQAKEYPFLTMKTEHGENPQNAGYGYVILPDKTLDETKAYAENPGFEVVEQSENMHAIRLSDGTVMANIFKSATLEGFRFITPCAVIIKPEDGGCKIYVSDPTQKQKNIRIAASEDMKVTGTFVTFTDGIISVDAAVNYGRSYEISCKNEGGAAGGDSSGIKVNNIGIVMNSAYMSTKLFASANDGAALKYKINSKPETGYAFIDGDRLYYYAPTGGMKNDESIVIEAYADQCRKAYFTVSIRTERKN